MSRFILLTCVCSQLALAYCTTYHGAELANWSSRAAIPIRLDEGAPRHLHHSDGTPWTVAEMEDEILRVVEMFNTSGPDIPDLYYAGTSRACPPGVRLCERIPGLLKITWSPDIHSADAGTSTTSPLQGQVIAFDAQFAWDRGGGHSWPNALVHEMTHALGLAHYYDCPPSPICSTGACSVVRGRGDQFLYQDDLDGLTALYGTRPLAPVDDQCIFGPDGSDFVTLGELRQPAFAASASSAVADQTGIVYRDPVTSRPQLASWESGTWTPWAHSETRATSGRMGVGLDAASGTLFTAYETGETVTNSAKRIFVRSHADPMSSDLAFLSRTVTNRQGVDAAWDPITGGLAVVWRADSGEIRVRVPDGRQLLAHDLSGRTIKALDTPSIACSDQRLDNCLLVWSNPAEPGSAIGSHFIRWMHLEFEGADSPDAIVPGPIITSSHVATGAVRVAYREGPPRSGGSGFEPGHFLISWVEAQPNRVRRIFVMPKPMDIDAPEQPVSLHGEYSVSPKFAFGSSLSCGWLFVWQ